VSLDWFEKELWGKFKAGEFPPDALPMPAKVRRVAEQAKDVQQDTTGPGLSEGNHNVFREPREKQDREVGKADRWDNRRNLWWGAAFIGVLFSRAVFIFCLTPMTTKK
jgi:hypothetical protein